MNKRGIEPVIATVLLIVITIAAVALIIAFVVPFVQRQLGTADLCLKAQGIQIDSTATCYTTTPGNQNVTVKIDWSGQGEKFTLKGIRISISNATKTYTPTWTDIPANPGESRTVVFQLQPPLGGGGGGVPYLTGNITQISIAPIVEPAKGNEITCEMRTIVPQPC